jgi:hypothetical protein
MAGKSILRDAWPRAGVSDNMSEKTELLGIRTCTLSLAQILVILSRTCVP